MPRTRLVWHLFASWCGLVIATMVAMSWRASVGLARLSQEGEYRRMQDVARMAEAAVPASPFNANTLAPWHASADSLQRATDLRLDLFDHEGNPVRPESDEDSSRGADRAIAAIRQGAAEARSDHYDAEQGRRVLTLAVATENNGILRVTSETTALDRELRLSQWSLLLRFLAAAAVAIAAGYVVAKRAAAGVEELAESASQLARGSLQVAIPTPDLAELSTIAAAATTALTL